ncbi:MAG: T9SS type A sorting domain-containing protein [Aureispira sp.]|nr:T9SS type A sorting domain-containing protein [Aureispira sp.]
MSKQILLLTLTLLSFALQAQVYVNTNATGTNDGTSWTNAYTSLQSALESSTAGTHIWVAQGTYKPSKDQTGSIPLYDKNKTFVIPDSIQVYGGFLGTETLLTQRNWKLYPTILEGDLGGGINTVHVVYLKPSGTSVQTVLDGMIVQNGAADNSSGGGLYSNYYCYAVIRNCIFRDNSGRDGGAIYIGNQGSPQIINCEFINNGTTYHSSKGGAVCLNYVDSCKVINCLFYNNTCTYAGGGLYVIGANNEISNCTFVGNSTGPANKIAKALACYGTATHLSMVNNCIFYENYPATQNDDFDGSYADIKNCISELGTANYTLTSGGGLSNLISGDPLFIDPSNENYNIECNSPAADVGDTTGVTVNSIDLDMQIRIFRSKIDLGAYENQDVVGIDASDLNICMGDYVTLSGTCDSAYTWTNGVVDGVAFIPSVTTTYTCTGVQTGQTAQVTIRVITLADETVNAANNRVCMGESTTVALGSSKLGASYFLIDDSTDLIVDGPFAGTGTGLNFNTGAINDTTTYNVYGGVNTIEKTINKALYFNGSQKITTLTNIPTTNNYSVEAWIYPQTKSTSHVIMSTYRNVSSSTTPYSQFIWNVTTTGAFSLTTRTASTYGSITTPDVVTHNAWNHVAMTFDNGTITFYVNGIAVHTGAITPTSYTTGYGLYLGGNNSNTYKLKGKMDEARIWTKTLTASEVLANMNACLDGTETDLYAYYELEENGTATTTIDKVAGETAYLGGTTWVDGVVGCENEVAFPKGSSLEFSGSYEKVTTSYSMPTTTNFSVEAWINPIATTGKKIISNYSGSGTLNAGEFYFDTYNTTNNGQGLRFTIGNSTTTVANVLTLGEWNHVAATFNNGAITLYVNGISVGTGSGSTSALVSTAQTVTLGEDATNGTSEFYQGLMDEVRIWNKTLSLSEINSNMNECLLGTEADLLLYYNFEEGMGSTLSGYPTTTANDGTLTYNGSVTTTMNWEEGSVSCASTCEQEMTQKVTIIPVVPDTSVTQAGVTLTSNATGLSYQWIDCNNSNTPVGGATNQGFTPSSSGDYAVIVTDGGCSDTSACFNVVVTGVETLDAQNRVVVYPNPTTGQLTLDLFKQHQGVQVAVSNIMGQKVLETQYNTTQRIDLQLEGASGLYFVNIKSAEGLNKTIRVIKE